MDHLKFVFQKYTRFSLRKWVKIPGVVRHPSRIQLCWRPPSKATPIKLYNRGNPLLNAPMILSYNWLKQGTHFHLLLVFPERSFTVIFIKFEFQIKRKLELNFFAISVSAAKKIQKIFRFNEIGLTQRERDICLSKHLTWNS